MKVTSGIWGGYLELPQSFWAGPVGCPVPQSRAAAVPVRPDGWYMHSRRTPGHLITGASTTRKGPQCTQQCASTTTSASRRN